MSAWLAMSLAEHGYKVRVLTETEKPISIERVKIVTLGSGRIRRLSASGSYLWRFILKLTVGVISFVESVMLIRKNCDLVLIVGISPVTEIFALIAQAAGKRVIYRPALMGDDDPGSIKGRFLGSVRWLLIRCKADFVALTPEIAEGYLRNGGFKKQLHQIPNPVNSECFYLPSVEDKTKIRERLGLPTNAQIILTVGRVCQRKGTYELVTSCLTNIFDNVPNAYLIVVGPIENTDGNIEYYESIKFEISKSRFGKRINFVGFALDPSRYFIASDIFVLPSKNEGFPSVFVEALSAGLPVVARDISGVTDYVFGSVNGVFIYRREEELSGAILKAIEAAAFDDVKRGLRRRALSRFSTSTVLESYMTLLSI